MTEKLHISNLLVLIITIINFDTCVKKFQKARQKWRFKNIWSHKVHTIKCEQVQYNRIILWNKVNCTKSVYRIRIVATSRSKIKQFEHVIIHNTKVKHGGYT